MTTLDDKLLGEKAQNYCSSSSEGEDEDDIEESKSAGHDPNAEQISKVDPEGTSWQGFSRNTGPKGVIRDWELFKEHERQTRTAKEKELVELCKKSTLTCRTEEEDERCKAIEKVETGDLDEDLLSDEILKDFIKKRFESMCKNTNPLEFGDLEEISSGEEYLKIVDGISAKVTVIIHVYDPRSQECARMNDCLRSVSSSNRSVKFCKIKATVAGLSALFAKEGVPALLVYKGGNMIGNFIRLKEDFGSEFYPGDVENFLIENGVLHEQNNLSLLMKDKCTFSP